MKKIIDLLTNVMRIGFNIEIFTLHTSAKIEILSHNIS